MGCFTAVLVRLASLYLCENQLFFFIDVQAALAGHLDVLRELLDHGANVPLALLLSPLILPLPGVKVLLEDHLVEYVS